MVFYETRDPPTHTYSQESWEDKGIDKVEDKINEYDELAFRSEIWQYTESWAHRGSVSDAPLSSVLDENFLHTPIFDVFSLVGSVQRIGDRCVGHWLKQIEIRCLLHRSPMFDVPEVPNVQMNEIKKIKLFVRDFFKI